VNPALHKNYKSGVNNARKYGLNRIKNGGVEIIIKNFQKKIPINPKRIKQAILKTLSEEGERKSGTITVSFVNDKDIRGLNKGFLGRDEPTDVLAFDLREVPGRGDFLADIVVSTDAAARNAGIFHTERLYETCLYVVHGVLHLLGYDDKNNRQRSLMDRMSASILTKCRYIKPKP
jgi:probable rRNA maturation factor